MIVGLELPRPPEIDPDDLGGSLARMQRWAVDFHAKVAQAFDDAALTNLRRGQPVKLPQATVAQLTDAKYRAGAAARFVFVTDEAGGPTPAYSDGTDWRRTSDGAVVS